MITFSTLSEICFIHGGNPSPKDGEFSINGIPFVKMKDLGKYHHTSCLLNTENNVNESIISNKRLKVIPKGSILLPRSGSVAQNHRAILGQDSVIVSHICALEIKENNKVFNKYLYYYLTTIDMVKITKKTTGLDAITFEDLGKIEIPLVPLETQKRIADVLDAADALRQKDQELLNKYDELAQAIFIDMFGDPVKNENGWEVISLKDFGKFKNGLNFNKQEKGVLLKYLGVGDFKSKYKIDNTEHLSNIELNFMPNEDFLLQNGDLVFVRSNGNKDLVGRCLEIFPEHDKVTFSGFCIRYRTTSNRLTSAYLAQLFRNKDFKSVIFDGGRGANINNINQEILNEIKIPLPSLESQIKFKNIQLIIENQINSEVFSSKNSNSLFQTLIQKAFKGELVA